MEAEFKPSPGAGTIRKIRAKFANHATGGKDEGTFTAMKPERGFLPLDQSLFYG